MPGPRILVYENFTPPIVSLMRVPNDLLFHEAGKDTVRISRQLDNVVTTIRGWGGDDGYTDDIVVMDTTMGTQNWRLELTCSQELTSLTNNAMVLTNALIYRNGNTTTPFGLGDTITVLTHESVNNDYGALNWSENVGIFLDGDTSPYLDYLIVDEYKAEFVWTLVHATP